MREQTHKLEITTHEAQVIVNGLRELPYKDSAELIAKVVKQVNEPKEEKTDETN